jgi:hypothetical protein
MGRMKSTQLGNFQPIILRIFQSVLTNHSTSDIDIGIYYDESAGFDINAVSEAATRLDDQHGNI